MTNERLNLIYFRKMPPKNKGKGRATGEGSGRRGRPPLTRQAPSASSGEDRSAQGDSVHVQPHPQPGGPEWEATIRAAAEAAAEAAIQQNRQVAIEAAMQAARRAAEGASRPPPSQGAESEPTEADYGHSSQGAQQGRIEQRSRAPAQGESEADRKSRLLLRFLKLEPPKFTGKLKP